MLPKFLIADNCQHSPGKLYVVHIESPRFVLEGCDHDFSEDQVMHWLDKPVTDKAEIERLIELAEDFLDAELSMQDDLFDELED